MHDLRSVGQMSASDNVIVHRKDVEMRCEDGLLNDDYYCEECYYRRCIDLQNLKKDYDSRSVARGEQQTLIKELEEAIKFLSNLIFVGEESTASSTGDVSIRPSDGSQFLADGLILRNRSDIFRSMLEEVDPTEKETRLLLIHEKVSGESVKAFQKFLYTAQLNDEDMRGNFEELVKLAYFYHVKSLLVTLDEFISKYVLTRDTVAEILKMSYLYQLERAKDGALTVIADYPNHELFDTTFKELQADSPLMAYQLFEDMVSLEYFITPELEI